MPSELGVQWVGEADAVIAVVRVVAVEFAETLMDEVDDLANDPHLLSPIADPIDGVPVSYTFSWYAYAVTVVVRVTERLRVLYVERVSVESSVGGINPYA